MTDQAIPSPDAFADLRMLLTLIVDAPACKRRLDEIEKDTKELAKERARLDADRAEHERKVAAFATERNAITQLKAELKAAKAEDKELSQQLCQKTAQDFMDRHPTPRSRQCV
jgi:septal ring factor EnvC (AmiA/AmiB activator)